MPPLAPAREWDMHTCGTLWPCCNPCWCVGGSVGHCGVHGHRAVLSNAWHGSRAAEPQLSLPLEAPIYPPNVSAPVRVLFPLPSPPVPPQVAGLSPDAHTYTSLIAGCAYGRQAALARELLRHMQQRGVQPSVWTHNAMLKVGRGVRVGGRSCWEGRPQCCWLGGCCRASEAAAGEGCVGMQQGRCCSGAAALPAALSTLILRPCRSSAGRTAWMRA